MVLSWNVMLLAFLGAAVMTGAETWYRFFVDRTDCAAPMLIAERWHKRHYQFNDQGYRDNINYDLPIKANRRITVLGDSFTAGAGVEDVDDRFANLLRQRLHETEVHVLGTNGHSTYNHYQTVQKLRDMQYPTNTVLLAYMMNDVAYCAPSVHDSFRNFHEFNYGLNYVQRNSYFINMLSYRWFAATDPDLRDYFPRLREAYEGECGQENLWVLQQMKQELAAQGIDLVVVTFPFMQALDDYYFRAAHAQLNAFWKAEGVPHLDLLPLYESIGFDALVVNEWDAHPNEYAHELTATAIQEFMEREGLMNTALPVAEVQ